MEPLQNATQSNAVVLPMPTGKTQPKDPEFRFDSEAHEGEILSQCVWVGNVAPDVSEVEFTTLFSNFGEVALVRMFPSSRCAFVTYKKAASARKSLQLEGKQLGSMCLTLNVGKASPHLWLGNIEEKVTEAMLIQHFAPFGTIQSVRVLRSNRCAFVNYTKASEALKAAEALNGAILVSEKIAINFKWDTSLKFNRSRSSNHLPGGSSSRGSSRPSSARNSTSKGHHSHHNSNSSNSSSSSGSSPPLLKTPSQSKQDGTASGPASLLTKSGGRLLLQSEIRTRTNSNESGVSEGAGATSLLLGEDNNRGRGDSHESNFSTDSSQTDASVSVVSHLGVPHPILSRPQSHPLPPHGTLSGSALHAASSIRHSDPSGVHSMPMTGSGSSGSTPTARLVSLSITPPPSSGPSIITSSLPGSVGYHAAFPLLGASPASSAPSSASSSGSSPGAPPRPLMRGGPRNSAAAGSQQFGSTPSLQQPGQPGQQPPQQQRQKTGFRGRVKSASSLPPLGLAGVTSAGPGDLSADDMPVSATGSTASSLSGLGSAHMASPPTPLLHRVLAAGGGASALPSIVGASPSVNLTHLAMGPPSMKVAQPPFDLNQGMDEVEAQVAAAHLHDKQDLGKVTPVSSASSTLSASVRAVQAQHEQYRPASRQLFVGNLPPGITEDGLWSVFGRFGDVESVKIFPTRGYAFVVMADINLARWLKAQNELYPLVVAGHPLVVDFGRPTKDETAPSQRESPGVLRVPLPFMTYGGPTQASFHQQAQAAAAAAAHHQHQQQHQQQLNLQQQLTIQHQYAQHLHHQAAAAAAAAAQAAQAQQQQPSASAPASGSGSGAPISPRNFTFTEMTHMATQANQQHFPSPATLPTDAITATPQQLQQQQQSAATPTLVVLGGSEKSSTSDSTSSSTLPTTTAATGTTTTATLLPSVAGDSEYELYQQAAMRYFQSMQISGYDPYSGEWVTYIPQQNQGEYVAIASAPQLTTASAAAAVAQANMSMSAPALQLASSAAAASAAAGSHYLTSVPAGVQVISLGPAAGPAGSAAPLPVQYYTTSAQQQQQQQATAAAASQLLAAQQQQQQQYYYQQQFLNAAAQQQQQQLYFVQQQQQFAAAAAAAAVGQQQQNQLPSQSTSPASTTSNASLSSANTNASITPPASVKSGASDLDSASASKE